MAKKAAPNQPAKAPDQTYDRQYALRVDAPLWEAIALYQKTYQNQHGLRSPADAIRHILRRVLRDENMLV